jgi:hypothetical protein
VNGEIAGLETGHWAFVPGRLLAIDDPEPGDLLAIQRD